MKELKKDFLQRLQIKEETLQRAIHALAETQKEYNAQLADGNLNDDSDQAQREASATHHYSLMERKAKELRNIERLIRRISMDEDFGLCEACGEAIPEERLMVVPEANLCVMCQREIEAQDRRKRLDRKPTPPFGRGRSYHWEDYEPLESHDFESIQIDVDFDCQIPADNEDSQISET